VSICLPSRLHCSVQVSAGVLFDGSDTQLSHLHCHNNTFNGFQLYVPHILIMRFQTK
jgi:hypothetical protein